MDLFARTLDCLDWDAVLAALGAHARTVRGRQAALRPDFAPDAAAVRARYAALAEVRVLEEEVGDTVPVGAVSDVVEPVARAARGVVLEPGELQDVGSCLQALDRLQRWASHRAPEAPVLWSLCEPISVDGELVAVLEAAFDDTGALSGETYPELGDLRARLRQLKDSIRRVLDELVSGDALSHALRDRYVTERGGRFVIPVKANARKGIGIVHGASQSGETVYVEPAQVVESTNESREVEAAIERTERRILGELSVQVGARAPELLRSLDAAVQVDLAVARAGLGRTLGATLPRVGEEGVIRLLDARHPVLVLRGVQVVANDLEVSSRRPALVLTGPNTGGKTVALKTLGLAALMVRAGIPVPAAEGTRVDLFDPILADVGDLQTVREDLSTFSGHLLVLDAMVRQAREGALVLLDEVGSGTDPAQGAVLARAVIEALVDRGARLAATTHFAELRAIAASDGRFQVAAVQVEDGRPTYRVAPGLAGQSHAFAVARRLGFDEGILARARALLDGGTRQLGDLMEALDEERANQARRGRELAEREAALRAREAEVEVLRERLEQRRRRLETDVVEKASRRLAEREEQVKSLIAALQEDPSLRLAGQTLDRIREVRARVREQQAALAPPRSLARPVGELAPGDAVTVVSLGQKGQVVEVLRGGQVEVQVGRLRMKVKRQDLARPGEPPPEREPPPPPAPSEHKERVLRGVRTPANTCDLRGLRVEGAFEQAEQFFDAALLRGEPVVFLLHGHGTGRLKQELRRWLPSCRYARSWRPADADEGGDAFTLVQLG